MEIASKAQAENGTDNNTVMTPLRVKQAINASGGGTPLPSNIAYTDQNNHFTQGQMIDGYLTVDGTQWQFGDMNVRDGKDIILAPQGPTDTPPTNDTGDIVFNQWRDEGGGAYSEIEKARIWTEDFYGLPVGPNYRAYDAQGNLLFTGHLALENNYSTDEKPIGVWKGYVLYRKIYEGYLNSNGTLDNRITVPGTIQRIEGYVYSIYANWWKIGSHYFPEPQYDSCFTIPQNLASFNIETNGYFNQNSKYVVIVEYTK